MKQHAPLLAATVDLSKIKFPVLVSPKLDGIRCVVIKGEPLSRKLKIIPNRYIQAMFKSVPLDGCDGELIVGKPYGEGVFARTSRGVMSHDGEPSFTYHVFDVQEEGSYLDRFSFYNTALPWVKIVKQVKVNDLTELRRMEEKYYVQGYEGLIGRDPDGLYKHGRSTMKEGLLWKLVRHSTDEATIIDFKEQMHNGNAAERDTLGHTKRSTAKSGKSPTGVLGAFVVESENYRDCFDVGTGFTPLQRIDFWNSRKSLRGTLIRFKHKPIGAVDAPRHPVFQGFRDKRDI